MRIYLLLLSGLLLFFLLSCNSNAQLPTQYNLSHFTEADSLRGMLTPERTCYDVTFYDLQIALDPQNKSISGQVEIRFRATTDFNQLQLDLFRNMKIDKITYENQPVLYKRKHDAIFVQLPTIKKGTEGKLIVYYQGQPTITQNAPWQGGFVWSKDDQGKDWIAVACEGEGASLWWPNKDHLSDEPDSMMIRITVPEDLVCIANGNLVNTIPVGNSMTRYDWRVTYPINNYNVTINVGDYVHFSDTYTSSTDQTTMPMDYYVLSYNLEKAKTHFQQVSGVLSCFEKYLGKYPFWEDGYALVETPYLGMEHQGAIAYGNQYMRGYKGGMIPPDMNWDYIIVHETGHEYFGNSISCKDHAEMWIHESFTTYLEALYVECTAGYEDALRYLQVFRSDRYIKNYNPIVGPLNVNFTQFGSSDHYFKGSWVLHTIRHAMNDDEKWFALLKDFYGTFMMQHIDTEEVISWFEKHSDLALTPILHQYLYYPKVPILEYRLEEKKGTLVVHHRWITDVKGFKMPILMGHPDQYQLVPVTNKWKKTTLKSVDASMFEVATDRFLVDLKMVQ